MVVKVYALFVTYVFDEQFAVRQIGSRVTSNPPSDEFIECNLRVCAAFPETWVESITLKPVPDGKPEGPLDYRKCIATVRESWVVDI